MWDSQTVQSSTSEEYPLHFVESAQRFYRCLKGSVCSTIIVALFEINDTDESALNPRYRLQHTENGLFSTAAITGRFEVFRLYGLLWTVFVNSW